MISSQEWLKKKTEIKMQHMSQKEKKAKKNQLNFNPNDHTMTVQWMLLV